MTLSLWKEHPSIPTLPVTAWKSQFKRASHNEIRTALFLEMSKHSHPYLWISVQSESQFKWSLHKLALFEICCYHEFWSIIESWSIERGVAFSSSQWNDIYHCMIKVQANIVLIWKNAYYQSKAHKTTYRTNMWLQKIRLWNVCAFAKLSLTVVPLALVLYLSRWARISEVLG